MTEHDFQAFVLEHKWTFAKTMPHMPHFWLARKDVPDADFVAAVEWIRAKGEKRPWGRRPPLTYLDHDGWTYWTMGNPVPVTTIINRKIMGTSMSPPGRP
jgi:hypothetical protein